MVDLLSDYPFADYARDDAHREIVTGLAGNPAVQLQQGAGDALTEARRPNLREQIGSIISNILSFGQSDDIRGDIDDAVNIPRFDSKPSLGNAQLMGDTFYGDRSGREIVREPIINAANTLERKLYEAVKPAVYTTGVTGRSQLMTGPTSKFLAEAGGQFPTGGLLDIPLSLLDRPGKTDFPTLTDADLKRGPQGPPAAPVVVSGNPQLPDGGDFQEFGDQRYTMMSALERYRQQEWQPYADEIASLRSEYGERLAQLRDELAGYKGGLGGINKAYGEYAEDANDILAAAAAVQGDPIPEGDTSLVAEAYDSVEGAMAETINQIGANGNTALAKELAEQITFMEGTITDALAGDLIQQDELFETMSAQAQAMAHMAWKDDLYNAERARYEMELQIQAIIAKKQDEIDAAKDAMDDAIQNVMDSYNPQNLTPDEVWQLASSDYFKNSGLNPFEQQEAMALWEGIRSGNPNAATDYRQFKGDLMVTMNEENLQKAGLLDAVRSYVQNGDPNNPIVQQVIEMMGTVDMGALARNALATGDKIVPGLSDLFSQLGFPVDGLLNPNIEWSRMNEGKYATVNDLWRHRRDFEQNYDRYTNVREGAVGGTISYNPEGDYAYPVMGQNWWSGGGYGYKKPDGRTHEGVDIHAVRGTPIVAATGGTVVSAGQNSLGGHTITIRDDKGRTHYYAHMDGPALYRKGDVVKIGTMIGRVGRSGNAGSTAHLHYGIRDSNGNPLNPTVSLRGVSTASGTRSPDSVRDRNVVWQPGTLYPGDIPMDTAYVYKPPRTGPSTTTRAL